MMSEGGGGGGEMKGGWALQNFILNDRTANLLSCRLSLTRRPSLSRRGPFIEGSHVTNVARSAPSTSGTSVRRQHLEFCL